MSTDDLDQITRLFGLRESGALSQHEYDTEKARILDGGGDGAITPAIKHDTADDEAPDIQSKK